MKKKKAVTWYYFLFYLNQVSILEYKHYLNEEEPLKYCILNVRKISFFSCVRPVSFTLRKRCES